MLGAADLSFADVAAILTDLTGVAFVATQVPDEQVVEGLRGLGMGEQRVAGIVGMARGMRSGHVTEDRRDVRTTTPTTFRAWAAEHLLPVLRGDAT